MRFLSVCSGIEAASVAWLPLGWECAAVSEIEAFPCAVLAHHYPEVPNLGDMTKITEADLDRCGPIDLLVGGTPCQSFSVAGLRAGMADPRGGLALVFLELARRARPLWVVWENVPGVLSADEGRAFGSFLGGLAELGYGFAYRVLDAQFFGVAQRRRRVFVVGHLGDWRRAAAVLFERACLRGDPAPSREAGAGTPVSPSLRAQGNSSHREDSQAFVAHAVACHASKGGDPTTDNYVAATLRSASTSPRAHGKQNGTDRETLVVAHALRAEGSDASEDGTGRGTPLVAHTLRRLTGGGCMEDGTGRGVPLVASPLTAGGNPNSNAPGRHMEDDHNLVAFHVTQDPISGKVAPAMSAGNRQGCGTLGVAFALREDPGGIGQGHNTNFVPVAVDPYNGSEHAHAPTLGANCGTTTGRNGVRQAMHVRRLTPRECERLQGFPDDYTLIPYRGRQAADAPRYRALGNSMAVPVIRWIGERVAALGDV